MSGYICAHCGAESSGSAYAHIVIEEQYDFCDSHCLATWAMNQSVHYNADFDGSPPGEMMAVAPTKQEGGSERNRLPVKS